MITLKGLPPTPEERLQIIEHGKIKAEKYSTECSKIVCGSYVTINDGKEVKFPNILIGTLTYKIKGQKILENGEKINDLEFLNGSFSFVGISDEVFTI